MTNLRDHLDEYLAVRRALGFKLVRAGKLLPRFVDHLERAGTNVITTAATLCWATQSRTAGPITWANRLALVRGFARYLQARDPRHEVPPAELLPSRQVRTPPYIYTPDEIAALLTATATLRSPLRTTTYATLLGLLAVTGMRVGEAIALDDNDVDLRAGFLTVRKGKFGKSREVPLHPSTTRALAQYARDRDRLVPRRKEPSFFVSVTRTRLFYQNVHEIFLKLVDAAGLAERRPRRPRLHDLRHTFAIAALVRWHRAGDNVEAKLPLLSTYLGHIGPATTYWYLTAVPELLAAAAARLERSAAVWP